MKGNVLLLGYGMQGKAALYDLLRSEDVNSVTVVDSNPNLKKELQSYDNAKIKALTLNFDSEKEIILNIMKDSDVVIDLLPYKFTFSALKMSAEAGVNHVSAMYFHDPGEADPLRIKQREMALRALNDMAVRKGIVLISEFGMDPGLDIIVGKKVLEEFDEVYEFNSYGAGFPELSAAGNSIKYKFTWSVAGVMSSYLRPATVIRDGNVMEIPAHEMFAEENMHLLKLDELEGCLECFPNGNAAHYAELMGIKSTVKNMGRYICRWQGHGSFWEVMAKSGFLNREPIEVNGNKIVPLEFCAALFGSQKQFYYSEHERDVALIRMDVKGIKDGKEKRVIYQIIDYRDLDTGFTAMARTTGFTAAIGANLVLTGKVNKKGIATPLDVQFDIIKDEISKRGIRINIHREYK